MLTDPSTSRPHHPIMDRSKRLRPLETNSRPTLPIIELDSPVILLDDDESPSDEISKDLAALERIRKSVQNNLRLRPIRSNGALDPRTSPSWRDVDSARSPTSATTSYYTPLSGTPLSATHFDPPSIRALDPGSLFDRLSALERPLLIDARPPHSHLISHIQYSINIAVPSLILKRCKKPAGAFQSLETLRQFITTEQGKEAWDELIGPGGPWDNHVVIYDDDMDPNDKNNPQAAAWALIPVIAPLLTYGSVDYLKGGISAARQHPDLSRLILSGGDFNFGGEEFEDPSQLKKGGGLFQLDTGAAARSKLLPQIEQSTLSTQPSAMMSVVSNNVDLLDSSPSPPPSQLAFHRRPPPRRPSAPSLRRLDTRSADHLNPNPPKLQVRTLPIKSATLSVPPIHIASAQPHSPSHINLIHSNHSPPGSAKWSPSDGQNGETEFHSTPPFTSYYTPPHTPSTPMPLPPSPATARPDLDQPPSSEEQHAEVFTISAILPNFLYLGPELTLTEHVEQLQELGVRRILNMAAECDDDRGLCMRKEFEKYVKIPWRDTVEEEDIARGVREVCEILGTVLPFQSWDGYLSSCTDR